MIKSQKRFSFKKKFGTCDLDGPFLANVTIGRVGWLLTPLSAAPSAVATATLAAAGDDDDGAGDGLR